VKLFSRTSKIAVASESLLEPISKAGILRCLSLICLLHKVKSERVVYARGDSGYANPKGAQKWMRPLFELDALFIEMVAGFASIRPCVLSVPASVVALPGRHDVVGIYGSTAAVGAEDF